MAINQLQIPSSNINNTVDQSQWQSLANLGNIYQKAQQDAANKAAFAAYQQTGDPKALLGSGDMNLAQLGISAQNHMDALKQQVLENKRANANLAINQGRFAHETEDWNKTPDQWKKNPDFGKPGEPEYIDTLAQSTALTKAKVAATALPDNYEVNPDYGKVEGAPRLRPISGGPADPTTLAAAAEAKTGVGMGDGAVELAARRLKEGDTSALTNIGRGAQAAHDLSRIQNRMADILVKEDGLSMADAAKKVSAAVQGFKASQVGQSAEARTGATREANLNLILKAADAAIPAALEASDAVARTGWVPVNKIIQKGEIATSDPNLMKFGMANLQLAEHWARAMNPTGVMRESDRDKALEFLSTATSKDTYRQLVEQLRTQITRERDAVKGAAPGAASPYSSSSAAPAAPGAAKPAGGVTHFSDYFK